MKKEALSQFGHPELILFAFLLFLISFLGIAVVTYAKSRKKHFESMAQMPLKENGGSHDE